MANTPSAIAQGKKARAESASPPPPPRPRPHTPPPQPPVQQPTYATPSSSAIPATSTSKRKRQTRIDNYFGSKKQRISPIAFELSPEEKKDVKALYRDIIKEEREAKKAEREAKQQLKRETEDAAARERQKQTRRREKWRTWCERNAKPNATFEIPENLPRGDLWALHRSITMCEKEFGLRRTEVFCLEHSCKPNWRTDGDTDITLFRMDDVQTLTWRKEAMLAGVECDNEEDLIAQGRSLFLQKQMAKHG
ncbi:hypothetical protein PMIN06_010716 [Paraphaeosphaeria minitans]|uniref:Uncharacterized protein n=1 Tax=Paraphaeosphaeria minitans TaxID=565426 RepID=A0A9P6GFS1_9PLEO|nr:hypothetical protein PMIN01_07512 [Paraphaeosphaeria minitans]